MSPTQAQLDAVMDIERLAKRTGGALLHQIPDWEDDHGWLHVRVLLSSASLLTIKHVVEFLPSEPIDIAIPPDFPFRHPDASVEHHRFAGLPHVQWGRHLCLYASSADWDAAAGITGYIAQIVNFYRRLASGALDGPQAGWHPPVTYGDGSAGCMVIREDLPEPDRMRIRTRIHWAACERIMTDRIDLIRWLDTVTEPGSPLPAEDILHAVNELVTGDPDRQWVITPVITLTQTIGFEYPERTEDLLHALASLGVPSDDVVTALAFTTWVNSRVIPRGENDDEVLTYLVIRATADRRSWGAKTPSHYAAWRLTTASALEAMALTFQVFDREVVRSLAHGFRTAKILWADVHDVRPNVVTRRDTGRPVTRLSEKRILLLGCGALGRPIAEHCIRAGAKQICLIDRNVVTPGILVRQGYGQLDIGFPKALTLAVQLAQIGDDVDILPLPVDVLRLDDFSDRLGEYDVLIDATADNTVAAKLEEVRRDPRARHLAVLSVGIDRLAGIGIATVSPPGAVGAGLGLLRQLSIAAHQTDGLKDVVTRFLDASDQFIFEPEPGCSSPTFIGSHADVTSLAAAMLNAALDGLESRVIAASPTGEARQASQTRSVCIVRSGSSGSALTRFRFADDILVRDQGHRNYEIRFDAAALNQLHDLIHAHSDDAVGVAAETGGLLLGQFNDACRVAWVTEITGPPPGTVGTTTWLTLNTPAAAAFVAERRRVTGGACGLIGYWHTHPAGPARPSLIDTATMAAVESRRKLMIVAGKTAPADSLIDSLYAEVVSPSIT